jgi:uncharacterized protein
MTKKIFRIKNMHCNSCAMLIENELKDKVNNISVSYSKEQAEIDFDENKISETKIKEIINKLGYNTEDIKPNKNKSNKIGWYVLIASIILLLVVLYLLIPNIKLPEIQIPQIGDKTGLGLLFLIGILTGFHCVSMCGAFVVS